jgi:prepilin-type N-terminal cleavage/methylation domain-containing protein
MMATAALFARRGRFTLIELLVVVAVIAILASMLLPALSKAREMSKRSACMNNLKQVNMTGVGIYADDSDGYPAFFDAAGAFDQIGTVDGMLPPWPHRGAQAGWIWNGCPSRGPRESPKYLNQTRSYGWNRCMGQAWTWNEIRTSNVRRADATSTWIDATSAWYSPTHFETSTLEGGRHLAAGANYSFVDMHNEWVPAYQWRYKNGKCLWPQSDTTAPDNVTKDGCIWHPY